MKFLLMLVTTCLIAILGLACDIDPLCEKIKPCRCYGNHSRLLVDCHGTNLNTTETCTLCHKVQNITSLDLSKNGLSDIPSRCFQECCSLLQLSLASNNLSWLKTDTFLGLSKLMHLNLNNNKLVNKNGEIANANFFKPLKNLQTLNIGRNTHELNDSIKFVYLANVAGYTINKLRNLVLDGLPEAVFDEKFLELQYLKQIDFSGDASYCNIINLTNRSFENVPYVTHLNLSRCNLVTIEAGTFEPLRLLKNLNLSYNMALGFYNLRNVAYGLQFTNIDELDYSKVYKTFGLTIQINRCDVWFLQNTTLRSLWLNSNRMASAETDAFRLLPRSLEILHVEDNDFSVAAYILQLGCLINLKRLELNRQETSHCIRNYNNEMSIRENTMDSSGGCDTHNLPINKTICPELENIPVALWRFTLPTTLRTVNFRASSLRSYPLFFPADIDVAVVPHTKSLLSLDVSNNILYFWDTFPIEAEHLETLNLSNNFCTNISRSFFHHFRNMLTLDASNNKLGPLLENDTGGSTFKYLQKVKHLNLSNNWIGYLPTKVFQNIPTVELLDLSFNRLTKISFGFEGLKELAQLYLQQNEISTLPLGLLEHFEEYSNNKNQSKKISIDLSNNPVDVTCDNMVFIKWMVQHSEYFHKIDSYTFYNIDKPDRKSISYDALLESLDTAIYNCQSYTLLIVISTLFILVSVSVVLGRLIYRYRWRLRYLFYMTLARYNGYTPVGGSETTREFKYDAFISYAEENYRFVTGEMYTRLEEAELSICLHQKDFIPGNDIAANILQAIRTSRMTVIILSNHFLLRKWCMYEFNMARMESIYSRDGKNILFIVLYEEIDIAHTTAEMREILESRTFLKMPKDEAELPYFWQMLIEAIK